MFCFVLDDFFTKRLMIYNTMTVPVLLCDFESCVLMETNVT